ncbi:proteasome maturation protein [Lepeophtheirus salmonis]|uniref:Proteasome maturation protein n=1 Tax=Lepeophtheirus salmonis TaxID=72036 RepID=D3PGF1_LEPSM|nr:uncharacterized protein LOC121128508 [Lepeophtheirus salmonis]ADD24347.1 Proteasome maturation protein [Lepeophtheirus salmonis]
MEIGPVNNYGLTDMMLNGITRKKDALLKSAHPLEISDRKYEDNVLQGELDMITKTQGRAAALRIGMELKATSQVGHFPFMSNRNHFSRDVLLNRDSTISFKDVLGRPEHCERGINMPHACLEKQLGIL